MLACVEEGVRHGGLGAVVAEVARVSMTSSRRLSPAAEAPGSMAIAVRRWRHQTEAADFGQPTTRHEQTAEWRNSDDSVLVNRNVASRGALPASASTEPKARIAPISSEESAPSPSTFILAMMKISTSLRWVSIEKPSAGCAFLGQILFEALGPVNAVETG